jgi:hypothetical protein
LVLHGLLLPLLLPHLHPLLAWVGEVAELAVQQNLWGSGKRLETTRDGLVMLVVVLKAAVRCLAPVVSIQQAALSKRRRR